MGIMADSTFSSSNRIYSLSEQIKASTRSIHSQLNRLIIAHLPLALPPQAADASIYIFGLLHITLIYTTFESLWGSILETSASSAHCHASYSGKLETPALQPRFASKAVKWSNIPAVEVDVGNVSIQTIDTLTRLRLPGLLRSFKLRADVQSLSGMSDHRLDENIEELSSTGKIAEFVSHIQRSVRAKPHVLLAYAWVFYMALFSGGRFVRKFVQAADQEFWTRPANLFIDNDESAKPLSKDHSIQFLNFGGDKDGEDIKQEFKTLFADAETQLTDREKEDITLESQEIFNCMIDVVTELHEAKQIDSLLRKHNKSEKYIQPR